MNIWKEAVKRNLTITTDRGTVKVTSLYKLPILSKTENSLDYIYSIYSAKVKENNDGLVKMKTTSQENYQLVLDLVKEVYDDKVAEMNKADEARKAKEELELLLKIKKEKELEVLSQTDLDTLEKKIQELTQKI